KRQPGLGLGRDPERAPIPRDSSKGAGFTTGKSWLPLPADHRATNVAVLSADPRSILTLYRQLIALRRAQPALSLGNLEGIEAVGAALVYHRRYGAEHLAILLNMGHEACTAAMPTPAARAQVLMSTYFDRGEATV